MSIFESPTINTGKKFNSADYWKLRATLEKDSENLIKSGFKTADKINKQLLNGYDQILKDIRRDISEFIATNPKLYNATATISTKEYLERMDQLFSELNKLSKNPSIPQSAKNHLLQEINATNLSLKRTRLEFLHDQINLKLSKQTVESEVLIREGLTTIYKDTVDLKQFSLQRGLGYGYQYSMPTTKEIEKVLLYPWAQDGSIFSDRLWDYKNKDTQKLVNAVRRTIASDIISMGKNPMTVASDLTGFGNPRLSASQIKFNTSRLLYTEASYIISEASAEVSQEWGIEEYTFLATLDNRTSSICRDLDGSTFKYKDKQVGTNYPPMHPLCRSTTYDVIPRPIYETRASRTKEGKTVQEIPFNVNYEQWKAFQESGKKTW